MEPPSVEGRLSEYILRYIKCISKRRQDLFWGFTQASAMEYAISDVETNVKRGNASQKGVKELSLRKRWEWAQTAMLATTHKGQRRIWIRWKEGRREILHPWSVTCYLDKEPLGRDIAERNA